MAKSGPVLIEASQVITCIGPGGRASAQDELGLIERGAVVIENGRIRATGASEELRARFPDADVLELGDMVLTPGLIDSHTHAVFGRWRQDEFEQRCAGKSYMEIAAEGGGILSSVRDLRERSEEELVEISRPRIRAMMEHGTTTAEVKSGYGLTHEDELKMLRAVRSIGSEDWIDLEPTFLGAHAFPLEYRDRREDYVELVAETMIPAVVEQGLARFCDVFMEPGVYSAGETRRVLEAGRVAGLVAKLHADELEPSGAAELAVELDAASADHLGAVSDAGIKALAGSGTVATLLPGTLLFLGKKTYAPARRLIDAGATVALATDFNPGSSPTVNIQLVMSLACTQMSMSPAEALLAVTVGGARALRLDDGRGTLGEGAPADVAAFDVTDYRLIPYAYGINHCTAVWKNGVRVK